MGNQPLRELCRRQLLVERSNVAAAAATKRMAVGRHARRDMQQNDDGDVDAQGQDKRAKEKLFLGSFGANAKAAAWDGGSTSKRAV